jgi:Protein of unknown function (DUF2884)
MRAPTLALLFVLAAGAAAPVAALDMHFSTDQCSDNYRTDFDVSITDAGIDFERVAGKPGSVFMHNGKLRVDGRDVPVSAEDAERIRRYEEEVRQIVPEVAGIAREGVDIGFSAMTSVTAAFSESGQDRARLVEKLNRKHAEALRKIDAGIGAGHWTQHDTEDLVEDSVADSVSELVGAVTASAVSAALSGDQAKVASLQARADSLNGALEREVNARADKLGARVKALCPRLARLDSLQQQWQFRLADGTRLKLMSRAAQTKPQDKKPIKDDSGPDAVTASAP